jgi:hypothetical protein
LEIDEFEYKEPVEIIKKSLSKKRLVLKKKIADSKFQFHQELEEEIGKQLNNIQEEDQIGNLIEKYPYQLMKTFL